MFSNILEERNYDCKWVLCYVILETPAIGETSSDQNLEFLSQMSLWRKHFSRYLHNFIKHSMIINIMEKYDIGNRCLLLYTSGFPDDDIYNNSRFRRFRKLHIFVVYFPRKYTVHFTVWENDLL